MRPTASLLLAAALALAAAAVAAPLSRPSRPPLRVVRDGGELYLVEGSVRGGRRLQLSGRKPPAIVRVGDATISYGEGQNPSLVVGSTKRPLELGKQVEQWLQDDARWGGHQAANDLRYSYSHGGIGSDLTEVVPVSDSAALGIVTLRSGGPSGEPVAQQVLIRLRIDGKDRKAVRVEWAGRLGQGNGASYGREPTRRLYRRGDTLLLLVDGRLCPFTPEGDRGAPLAAVPEGESTYVGFADQRYILLDRTVRGGGTVLEAFDLERLVSFPVLNLAVAPDGADTYLRAVPEEGDYLLLAKRERGKSSDAEMTFTIHLPDGRRARMSQLADQSWRDYAIGNSAHPSGANTVDVLDARTGRRVARLWQPK